MKVSDYTGQNLVGAWDVSLKLDGFQVKYKEGKAYTRGSHELPHFPKMEDGIYEYFRRSWSESIGALSDHVRVLKENLFRIDVPDRSILLTTIKNPTSKQIRSYYQVAVASGFEGIVLRREDIFFRIKPSCNHDVEIVKMLPGYGPYEGAVGSIETTHGKVSSGLSMEQRHEFWKNRKSMVGKIIECKCKSITPTGKMREPVFLRVRPDKTTPSPSL